MSRSKRLLFLALLVSPLFVFLFLDGGPGGHCPFPPSAKRFFRPSSKPGGDRSLRRKGTSCSASAFPGFFSAWPSGAALSVSGASLQAVFKNPLVNEYILGLSSGAAFGASLSIVVFGSSVPPQIAAFAFALLAVGLVLPDRPDTALPRRSRSS